MKIPLFKPYLGKEELRELALVFKSAWVGGGPKTVEFEEKFAKTVGAKYAIGVTSGTAALHLALQALDITSGEVIIPTITHAATANAAIYNGALPVFADIEEDSLCIDVDDIKRKITSKTKAIIPVHLGGHSADMDKIMILAKRYNLKVVEDSANALITKYKGKVVGTIGDIGCYSFESKKNMTTGDGGMIVTNDKKLAERLRRIRWHGADRDTWKRFTGQQYYSWRYDITELGWKYNMTDVQAAIGLAQLKKLPWMLSQKDKIRKMYNKELKGIPWLKIPIERPYTKGGQWLYVIRVDKRDEFMDYITKHGITTGVHFEPLYSFSYLKKMKIGAKTPVTERVWKHILSLPYYPTMTKTEFKYVVKTIKSFK